MSSVTTGGRDYRAHCCSFHSLVSELAAQVNSSKGSTAADIDHLALQRIMQKYSSDQEQWQKFAFADPSRAYTRNLVDEGNGRSNLMVLVWNPSKSSPVHDHADAHCVMKILKGRLRETRYQWPKSDLSDGSSAPLETISTAEYVQDQVAYMSDSLGLHRISNPDPDEVAVSLHLYTPPNAAKEGCYIFDQASGKRSHVAGCVLYSAFGNKL